MNIMEEAEAVRRERVRQLFQARPAVEHTETTVLLFYAELQEHHGELLPKGRGDAHKHLKADLSGLHK
jgi:hypothetical protein